MNRETFIKLWVKGQIRAISSVRIKGDGFIFNFQPTGERPPKGAASATKAVVTYHAR